MAHGSGGTLTHRLLREIVFPAFSNHVLDKCEDAAVVPLRGKCAFTTDSFVIQPLFFPGGDIGKLAVCGTVNDLAVMGARPAYMTAACIIEEGLRTAVFRKIVGSIAKAAKDAGVLIAGGDMKVVEKGACDKIFINTTGIGTITEGIRISADNARPGDHVIINGTIGDHGAAVMSARKDYKLRSSIRSDCASLNGLIERLLNTVPRIRVMRDPTRGGVATTLKEIAVQSNVEITIEEDALPVTGPVRGFCEILGVDPLYMANEGKVLVFAPEEDARRVVSTMRKHALGRNAAVIGRVTRRCSSSDTPQVLLHTSIGSMRIIDMLSGEQLPRIC
ncbi:MAG TPA: hydrogenase expression/formation protein HypE [Candidatus Omnitrophota bacterium]|nr:hydrogenase expression/formation protein HypE [Candidatus Omnitrophota bacterium]